MLIRDLAKTGLNVEANCDYCGGDTPAVIEMHGYGDGPHGSCHWCADCALQLARKITEDLCELLTKGGRHG